MSEEEETNVVEETPTEEAKPEEEEKSPGELTDAEFLGEYEEDLEEEETTPKVKKKSPPKSNPQSKPQPKKESKKMAKKTAEEKGDYKMIRVSGDTASNIYRLAAQIQLDSGERTNPGDAIAAAVEQMLK